MTTISFSFVCERDTLVQWEGASGSAKVDIASPVPRPDSAVVYGSAGTAITEGV